MTKIYITIDTEYSYGLFRRSGRGSRAKNFARSIACGAGSDAVGIDYQMDVFDRHGLKAVFFVDPLPALVWGEDAIRDIVAPIVSRGHDVQLHMHTEWLAAAGDRNPLGDRTGLNAKDFSREDQRRLLAYSVEMLMAAGAPHPVAFRAGNYGANDDTLRALADLGIRYDTSHCPGIAQSHCAIGLPADCRTTREHRGVVEVPIASIAAHGGGSRHAQLTALSAQEIIAAIAFARDTGQADFTLVSHSFELMSRDRKRVNRLVKRRFERVCAALAAMPGVATATYRDDPPRPVSAQAGAVRLPHSWLRTVPRMAEQALGNALYGAK